MPELPEVETIKRQLDAKLAGAKITAVTILRSGRESPRGRRFVAALVGKRVKEVARRAKLLIWKLGDGSALTAHLKMTGRFVSVDKKYEPQKHDRIIFEFTSPLRRGTAGGSVRLVWSDVRQFGYVRLFSNSRELENSLASYGPEPLQVTAAALGERLHRYSTRKVKAALLDQTVIAGVGNIYADEALHRAGILPTRRLSQLNDAERMCLGKEIQKVLRAAIAHHGTTADDYVDTHGKPGGFAKLLRVYGRAGKPCKICRTPIKKIVLAGRGTHYCPHCQQ